MEMEKRLKQIIHVVYWKTYIGATIMSFYLSGGGLWHLCWLKDLWMGLVGEKTLFSSLQDDIGR